MRSVATKVALASMLVAVALAWPADPAFAKILPVSSIEVATAQPTVGHRVEVLVRLGVVQGSRRP